MPDESSTIPLVDVFRAANELVSAGLIEDYALGGALAAIYYVEPFITYDADIIFVANDKTLSAGIPAIYSHLQSKGWRVEREHLLVKDFPVRFLAASGLTEKPCAKQNQSNMEAFLQRYFVPNTSLPSPRALADTRIWPGSSNSCHTRRSTRRFWTKSCGVIT